MDKQQIANGNTFVLKEIPCANPDCKQLFKVGENSKQEFHSTDCELKVYPERRQSYKRREHSVILTNKPKVTTDARPRILAEDDDKKLNNVDQNAERKALIEKRWFSLVKQAQIIVENMNKDRMRVAELAIEACEITRGGDFRRYAHVYTLQKYAKEIKISYKTLANWVRIKKNVYDKLVEAGENVDPQKDWTAMNRVADRCVSDVPKEQVVKSFKHWDKKVEEGKVLNPQNYFLQGLRRLRSTAYFLKRTEISKNDFPENDRIEMLQHCKTIIAWLEK